MQTGHKHRRDVDQQMTVSAFPGAVLVRPEPRCAIAVSCDQLREQIDEAARRCSHAE